MKITLANNKGGTGKTTTALFLATAASRSGYSVRVLDTDQDNATAERWAIEAESKGTPLPFTVTSGNTLSVHRDYNEDIVFIDTPGASGKMFNAAIDAADLVIIPTGASRSDVSTTWNVLNEIGRPALVLVTQEKNGTKATKAILHEFREHGQAVVPFAIPHLERINQAYGSVPAPAHMHGYDDLWDELDAQFLSEASN